MKSGLESSIVKGTQRLHRGGLSGERQKSRSNGRAGYKGYDSAAGKAADARVVIGRIIRISRFPGSLAGHGSSGRGMGCALWFVELVGRKGPHMKRRCVVIVDLSGTEGSTGPIRRRRQRGADMCPFAALRPALRRLLMMELSSLIDFLETPQGQNSTECCLRWRIMW